jgi:predicted transcriptional regulator of viral defense system
MYSKLHFIAFSNTNPSEVASRNHIVIPSPNSSLSRIAPYDVSEEDAEIGIKVTSIENFMITDITFEEIYVISKVRKFSQTL